MGKVDLTYRRAKAILRHRGYWHYDLQILMHYTRECMRIVYDPSNRGITIFHRGRLLYEAYKVRHHTDVITDVITSEYTELLDLELVRCTERA